MSRRYNRAQKEYQAASHILRRTIRIKPCWFPKFLGMPIFRVAARIVFR